MKNTLSLVLFLLLCSACPKINNEASVFDGKWQMESYIMFSPERPDFNDGDVVWTFNTTTQKVSIENNLSGQYPFLKPTGTYAYSEMTDESKITIDGRTFDYKLEGDKLTLSDKPELDGPMIEFKRLK